MPVSQYAVDVALRWSDMDAYGHVNNVQFLRLLEDARVAALADWLGNHDMLDSGIVVNRHEIEYLAPLVFRPAPVRIRLWPTAITATGFDVAYEMVDPPEVGTGSVCPRRIRARRLRLRHGAAAPAERRRPGPIARPLRGDRAVPVATPMSDLLLADAASLDDLRTYAARARRLDPEAAVRLLAAGPVLAAYVGVLPGRGVTGSGATLGLRVFGLAEPTEVDVTVPAAAILDRLARDGSDPGEAGLPIPPMSVFVPWAGITPPRSGWDPYAAFPGTDVIAAAEAGIAEVGVAGTGLAAQVEALRSRVWAQPLG
jgi:acyl-CoA thioesterase FadM